MVTLTVNWYAHGLKNVSQGNIDLDNDTIKCALTTSSYTPSQNSHEFFDTHVTNEVSGTGYTSGGETVTGNATSYSSGTTTFDADDVQWTSSTITARNVVLYVDGTAGSGDFLIGYGTLASDQSSSSGTFTVSWNASGILTVATS